MAASFWLLLAPLLTGASVGLLVAFLLEEDNPWRSVGLLAGTVIALLLRCMPLRCKWGKSVICVVRGGGCACRMAACAKHAAVRMPQRWVI